MLPKQALYCTILYKGLEHLDFGICRSPKTINPPWISRDSCPNVIKVLEFVFLMTIWCKTRMRHFICTIQCGSLQSVFLFCQTRGELRWSACTDYIENLLSYESSDAEHNEDSYWRASGQWVLWLLMPNIDYILRHSSISTSMILKTAVYETSPQQLFPCDFRVLRYNDLM